MLQTVIYSFVLFFGCGYSYKYAEYLFNHEM